MGDGLHVRRMVEGNGCEINLYQVARGRRFDPHQHPFAELGVVLSGRGTMIVGEEERTIREGDSFYVPGNAPHGFAVTGNRPAVLLNVTVPQLPEMDASPSPAVLRLAALSLLNESGIAPSAGKRTSR